MGCAGHVENANNTALNRALHVPVLLALPCSFCVEFTSKLLPGMHLFYSEGQQNIQCKNILKIKILCSLTVTVGSINV